MTPRPDTGSLAALLARIEEEAKARQYAVAVAGGDSATQEWAAIALSTGDVLALVEVARAARDLRESIRIEPYHGVKYKILCPRCGGLGEVGPENHDDPKAWPCSECEGLGVRPAILAAIRATDAALERLE